MPFSNTSQNSFQKKAERMKIFCTSQRNKLQRATELQVQVQEEERRRLLMADRLTYLVADQSICEEPLR